eukprot:gb/GECG01000831.1/.p1 GENE.gb/GECG01000831.1/~~gb/GECG01000831.1/.p1  ORF type:complete len:180 (+),score=9.70 gb/GECG01000831.1/:1-540(+)
MSVPTENHIDLTQDSGSESSPEDTPDRDKAPARRRAKATKRRCTSPLETPAKHDYCSNGEYDQRSTEGYHASEKRLEVSRKTRANDIVSLRVVARPLQKPYTATGNGRWTFAIREFVSTKVRPRQLFAAHQSDRSIFLAEAGRYLFQIWCQSEIWRKFQKERNRRCDKQIAGTSAVCGR